ncbi:MAG: hypothetical protein AB1427_00960 [Thermodesulfobacteriota bacterium]
MKAILDNDVIISLSTSTGTEIGSFPKGAGLERLRFDGQKVVDLALLSSIWVREPVPGFYELHAVSVPGSQSVAMTYAQRANLTTDPGGAIRVKTPAEIDAERLSQEKQLLKNRLRKRLEAKTGDAPDQLADAYKLIFALIVYARTGSPVLGQFFDSLIPDIKDIYPLDHVQAALIQAAKDLKAEMAQYYAAIDGLK